MIQPIFPRSRLVVPKRKRVQEHSGMSRHVADGEEEVYYATSIDLNALREMAVRAARSKGGKCVDGPLRVEIIERLDL